MATFRRVRVGIFGSGLREPRFDSARPRMAYTPYVVALEGRQLLSAGDRDLTFGVGGIAENQFQNRFPNEPAIATDAAIQSDGKIVVQGWSNLGNSTFNGAFLVARYTATGQLDPTFGTGGTVVETVQGGYSGSGGQSNAVAIQKDGKILIAGVGSVGSATNPTGMLVLMRENPDGSPDLSFGNQGQVASNLGSGLPPRSISLSVQSDGTIKVAGAIQVAKFFELQFDAAGHPKSGFGSNGTLVTQVDQSNVVVSGVNFLPAGGVLVEQNGHILKFSDQGQLDKQFGVNGAVTLTGQLTSFTILADGSLIAATGTTTKPGSITLSRFDSNGHLDTSFGSQGTSSQTLPGVSFASASDVQIAGDGHILVTGVVNPGTVASEVNVPVAYVARFNGDGSLDQSFGAKGVVYPTFKGLQSITARVKTEADGRIIVIGTDESATYRFAVARFLDQGPGTVGFGASAVTINKGDKKADIVVNRTGSLEGPAAVSYSTADQSAVAGRDYVASSGVLNFADGESSKTIEISTLDDPASNVDRTFSVKLSSPSAGVTISSLNTAGVDILPKPVTYTASLSAPSPMTSGTINAVLGKDVPFQITLSSSERSVTPVGNATLFDATTNKILDTKPYHAGPIAVIASAADLAVGHHVIEAYYGATLDLSHADVAFQVARVQLAKSPMSNQLDLFVQVPTTPPVVATQTASASLVGLLPANTTIPGVKLNISAEVDVPSPGVGPATGTIQFYSQVPGGAPVSLGTPVPLVQVPGNPSRAVAFLSIDSPQVPSEAIYGVYQATPGSVFLGSPSVGSAPAYSTMLVVEHDDGDEAGTLRYALTNAGLAPDHIIHFALPGSGPQTITLDNPTPLPAITTPVTLDGFHATTQVVIDGGDKATGLKLTGTGIVVQGLVINHIFGPSILIQPATLGVTNDLIVSNFLGTDATGLNAAGPNQYAGVEVSRASGNVIAGNLIAGLGFNNEQSNGDTVTQGAVGVRLEDQSSGNIVESNKIGVNQTGAKAIGVTAVGILVDSSPSNAIRDNLIAGNSAALIYLSGQSAAGNTLSGNVLGTTGTGTLIASSDQAPDGIDIVKAPRNILVGNIVAGYQRYGINISDGATGNILATNLIGSPALDKNGANLAQGIVLSDSPANTFASNLIVGNSNGAVLTGAATQKNVFKNNIFKASTYQAAAFGLKAPASQIPFGEKAGQNKIVRG